MEITTTIWPSADRLDGRPRLALAPPAVGHLPALDGVRGLAVALVLFHHFTILPAGGGGVGGALDGALRGLSALGASGVDLFFVLSGFLITGILLDAKGSPGYFRNFYARRSLRIFPLYYAVVLVALVVLPRVPAAAAESFRDPADAWSYWLYLSNVSMAYHGAFRHAVLDVTWSLAIEEQFYLVWPAVVLWLGRAGLARACGAMIVVGLLTRGAMLLGDANPVAVYLLTPCRMDGLAAGALVAVASRGPLGVRALVRPAVLLGPACAAALAAVLATQGLEYWDTPLGLWTTPTLFAGAYASLLVLILAGSTSPAARLRRAFSWPWLRGLGKYSYALYLLHVPVATVIAQSFYGPDRLLALGSTRVPGQVLFYVMATCVSLAGAWLSWELFERHFLKLKRYFPTGRDRAMPPPEFRDRPIVVPASAPARQRNDVKVEDELPLAT